MQLKKTTKIVLCIALAFCLISMIGTACMQGNWGKTDVKTYYVTLAELGKMIRANNETYGKDIQVTFTENKTAQFSFMTLIPKSASESNPVPGVVVIHGGSNTKEMQMNNYIELARRGYVVVAMDMAGHGYSSQAVDEATHGTLGSEAAVEYIMSLGCVDKEKVGVTGHSTGGNSSCFAVDALNTPESTQRIRGLVAQCGTMGASKMRPDSCENLIATIGVSYYDEFDTVYFDSPNILSNDAGKAMITRVYEGLEGNVIDGQWYSPEGPVDAPSNGEAIAVDTAVRMVNPKITHPMFHFTKTGTGIVINGMYSALGTPSGSKYIPESKQIWPVMVAFEFLGLIGFFMLVFPLVDILIETPLFSGIKRKTIDNSNNKFKSAKEIVVVLVTIALLVLISFKTFDKLFPTGSSLVNQSIYAARGTVGNGVGVWTIVCGLVLIIAMIVGYFARRLLANKSDVVANPFEAGALDSVGQFLKTVLFAFTVVALMFVPLYIGRYVFNADFRICSFVAMAPMLKWLPMIFVKYLPWWILFYVPCAIFNANARYSDIPEWASTTICAVSNCLALILYIIIQYSHLYKYAALWSPDGGMAGIAAFAIAPCLAFAAYSSRYIYKKTGNAWAAGTINALIMCLLTIVPNGITSDLLMMF